MSHFFLSPPCHNHCLALQLLRLVGEATQSRRLATAAGSAPPPPAAAATGTADKKQPGLNSKHAASQAQRDEEGTAAPAAGGKLGRGRGRGGRGGARGRGRSSQRQDQQQHKGGAKRPRRGAARRKAGGDDSFDKEDEVSSEPAACGSDSEEDSEVFMPAAKRRTRARQQQQQQLQLSENAGTTPAAGGGGGGGSTRNGKQQSSKQRAEAGTVPAPPSAPAAGAAEGTSKPAAGTEAMTLVLFDEADSLLESDRGFLAALPGLIRDSRRPIVLCLNEARLPAVLAGVAAGVQVQQAMLLRPQPGELLRLLVLVLAAEGRRGFGLQQVQEVMTAHVSVHRESAGGGAACWWLRK